VQNNCHDCDDVRFGFGWSPVRFCERREAGGGLWAGSSERGEAGERGKDVRTQFWVLNALKSWSLEFVMSRFIGLKVYECPGERRRLASSPPPVVASFINKIIDFITP